MFIATILRGRVGGIAPLTAVREDPPIETPHETVWLGRRGWHRPRTRWFVLGGLIAAAGILSTLAALILGGHVSATFQPLSLGCCTVRAYDGTRSTYGWTLRNNGRFDVRVTDVEGGDIPGLFTETRVEIVEQANVYVISKKLAFRPFTLAPGDERFILFSGVVSCTKARQGLGAILGQQRVHFTVLDVHKIRWIPFGDIPLKAPPGTCPGSKL